MTLDWHRFELIFEEMRSFGDDRRGTAAWTCRVFGTTSDNVPAASDLPRMKLSKLIKQETFTSLAQETILNVMVTNSWLVGELSAAMGEFGITPVQYNVLRILRGSHPARMTCSQIGERMLDRTPDVTRMLDRLERSGLIERARAEHDRRVVEVGISKKGRELLDRMDDDIAGAQHRLTRHLSESEQRTLCELLEKLRIDQ